MLLRNALYIYAPDLPKLLSKKKLIQIIEVPRLIGSTCD